LHLAFLDVLAAEVDEAVAGPATNGSRAANITWWEGHFMGMSFRRVLALTLDRAVMCYSRWDGAACRAAGSASHISATIDRSQLSASNVSRHIAGASAEPGQAAASDNGHPASSDAAEHGDSSPTDTVSAEHGQPTAERSSSPGDDVSAEHAEPAVDSGSSSMPATSGALLSPLAWGEPQVLDASPTNRIEAERLSDDRFIVCFEHSPAPSEEARAESMEWMVSCRLGLVRPTSNPGTGSQQEAGQGVRLEPLSSALDLGPGRLVAVSVLEAGRRFAVCQQGHARAGAQAATATESALGVGRMSTSCRWAEVVEASGAEQAVPSLRWSDDAALKVFSSSDAGTVAKD